MKTTRMEMKMTPTGQFCYLARRGLAHEPGRHGFRPAVLPQSETANVRMRGNSFAGSCAGCGRSDRNADTSKWLHASVQNHALDATESLAEIQLKCSH